MSTDPTPSLAEQHKTRAVELRKAGKFDESLALLDEALKLQPEFAAAHFNIGAVRIEQGKYEEAIAAFRKAIRLKPEYHQAFIAMATALRRMGKLREAIDAAEEAVRLKPDDADARATLGTTFHAAQCMDESVEQFEHALSLRPRDSRILNNFGNLLMDIEQPVRAAQCYRAAIAIDPNRAELFNNLGNMLKVQGELDEAIACYQRTLTLKPEMIDVHSNLLLTLNCHPRSEEGLLPAHKEWAKRHAAKFYPANPSFPNDRSPTRKLRVGYISPDFRRHSVSYFVEPIVAAHNRSAVEVFCYSDVVRADDVTGRFKAKADSWREITGIPDERVDQMIRDDRIDILVDLAGHTGGGRMLVFARKPAPIQVSYLGYPNTTGLETMDYRLTDDIADPPSSSDRACVETLVRLPHGFHCYKPFEKAPVVRDLNVAGANDFAVTFGTFNNFAKITSPMLAIWAKILDAVPGSTLLIKADSLSDNEVRQGARNAFAEQGGDPLRFEPIGREPSIIKHLATYHQMDIALDTFPYNGTTTTCEAMWMGVPVVTLCGRAHHSRVGASLLTRVGLSGLIAKTPEDYISIAVSLAKDTSRRRQIAAGMRNRLRHSPLMDSAAFVKDLEEAYRTMWRKWCSADGKSKG